MSDNNNNDEEEERRRAEQDRQVQEVIKMLKESGVTTKLQDETHTFWDTQVR